LGIAFSAHSFLNLIQRDPKSGFVGSIGKTPLIRLKSMSEETGCNILAKAEFMEPGGSVKDRAAYYIIKVLRIRKILIFKDAEDKGLLKPGGVVVEGTAGICSFYLVSLRKEILELVWLMSAMQKATNS
jgi:hypothetical protein